MPQVVSFVGRSNSGKTTLISRLVAELKSRNLRVGVIKHAHHGFQLDKEGSDSSTYKKAGADGVMLASPRGMAMFRLKPSDTDLDHLLEYFSDMDLVITEGFKQTSKPKIEVWRSGLSEPPLGHSLENLVGLVSDEPIQTDRPCFSPSDIPAIADFILSIFSME